jgi:mannose-6-phosphate isomerase-like protein (cupin superfamily)
MAGYTLKNLKQDVEDQAPNFGYAPNIEARFAGDSLELESSGVSYQAYAPNFRQPFGHNHKQQEELYVVVGGSGRLKLDDEIVDLKQWDAVRIPPEITRGVESGPEGIELLIFGAPSMAPSPMEDVELAPNWWTD